MGQPRREEDQGVRPPNHGPGLMCTNFWRTIEVQGSPDVTLRGRDELEKKPRF